MKSVNFCIQLKDTKKKGGKKQQEILIAFEIRRESGRLGGWNGKM